MINFKVDKKQFAKTMAALSVVRKSAIPLTMRMTLNDAAYAVGARATESIKGKFTTRNKFTERGIWVQQATQRDVRDMTAVVGHRSSYMEMQETGGVIAAKKEHKPIPTKGARIGKSASKVVRKPFRMNKLRVRKGSKFFVGNPRGKKGIFMRMKRRVVMLWDLSRKMVTIKKRPWFEPVVAKVSRRSDFATAFFSNAEKVFRRFL